MLPAIRSEAERADPHPVYRAFMENRIGRAFARDEVRETAIPAYMGLIKQCDDQLGHLLDHLEATGRMEDTAIVLTSDHGDYLGDHWLGEKDLFHAPSVKVPLIVYDPSEEADATRGTTCSALVEAIDLAATFIEMAGGAVPGHVVEGRSLRPYLRGETPEAWRDVVISEYDYSTTPMAAQLGVSPRDARLFMLFDGRWKYIHAEGFRPMLFDLLNDPQELRDLGADPRYKEIRARMAERLATWARRPSQRTTQSEAQILDRRQGGSDTGVVLGLYNGSEIDPSLTENYRGKPGNGPGTKAQ